MSGPRARVVGQAGFSLAESLIGTLVLTTVTAAVLAVLDPAAGFGTQAEVADVNQRLRVAATTVKADLAQAGAGVYGGAATGGLMDHLAPVLPYRAGLVSADLPGTFRTDVLTVRYVSALSPQSRVRRVRPGTGAEVILEMAAACGGARQDANCGFREGMRIVVFDDATWDVRTVARVESDALYLSSARPLSSSYDGGDAVAAELESYTYYLRTDRSAQTYQLMRYDGASTDLPVVDDVVKLQFKYWGAAAPPQLVAGVPPEERRTTYGPRPSALDRPSRTSWADGESCTFVVVGGAHAPRLPTLPAEASGLAQLAAGALTDGPWCPDAAGADRFDADLLRIRRIRVEVRVQAGSALFRGPASPLFMHAGTARPSRYVPDLELAFDVSPRNMHLER